MSQATTDEHAFQFMPVIGPCAGSGGSFARSFAMMGELERQIYIYVGFINNTPNCSEKKTDKTKLLSIQDST